MLSRTYRLLLLMAAGLLLVACSGDDDTPPGEPTAAPHRGDFILATTTSTQDSGLLDVLLPLLEKRTGWTAKPIAVGSGQAMAMGRQGDADVLLVHSPDAEAQFMNEGYVKDRVLVMHNDFILIGPASDPAGARGKTAVDALRAVAARGSPFISRGDSSGTHALELTLWRSAGLEPRGNGWYQESGQGMGATLQIADQKDAYTLSDRATFLAQQQNLALKVLNEGDRAYFNVYHVLTLNPQRNPGVNSEAGQAFAAFMVAPETQEIIRSFGIDKYGQALFVPDAGKAATELGVH